MRTLLLSISFILVLATGSPAQSGDPVVLLYEISSTSSYPTIGRVLSGGGDYDGDGFDDFAIGSFGLDLLVGRARVYSGIGGILLGEYFGDPAWNIPPPNCPLGGGCGETFGAAVLLMDLDADPSAELVVGAPGASYAVGSTVYVDGRVAVYDFGVAGPTLSFFPPVVGSNFGHVLADAGDLDADGLRDVLVSSPGYDIPGAGFGNTGAAWALAGPALSSVLQFVQGVQAGEWFGGTLNDGGLAGLGDVDGDGHDDWATGSPKRFNGTMFAAGLVEIVSGATGGILQQWQGNGAYQNIGKRLAALGDVDGDSVGDLAFSDLPLPVFNPGPQTLYVVSGSTGSTIYTLSSPTNFGIFKDLSRVLDVTGDGRDEILVGHLTGGGPIPYTDRVSVLSGTDGSLVFQTTSTALTNFGDRVSGAGDLNEDGLGDFLFSWENAPVAGTALVGKVLVYAARNLAVAGTPVIGGNLTLSVKAPRWPGRPFVIVFSQADAGFLLGSYWIPISPDGLFFASLEMGLGGTLNGSGQGTLTLPIPNDPSLQGATVYAGGAVIDWTPSFAIRSILTATTVSIP